MAFANIGAASGMVDAGSIRPSGAYDGDAWDIGPGSGNLSYRPQRVNALEITGAQLTSRSDDTSDGSSADTGVLVTASPGANQHGIPSNFGPGRGNWTDDDLAWLDVIVENKSTLGDDVAASFTDSDSGGSFYSDPHVVDVSVANGDLTVAVKLKDNGVDDAGGASSGDADDLSIKLRYLGPVAFS